MKDSIKCQSCGQVIDINEAVRKKIQAEFSAEMINTKRKFDAELEGKRAECNKMLANLQTQQEEFNQNLKNATNLAVKKELQNLENEFKKEKEEYINSAKKEFESENLAKFEFMQKELDEKSKKLSELNQLSAQFEALKRANSELEAKFKAESELKISEQVKAEKEKILKQVGEENELKFMEKDKKVADLIKQIDELKRKSEVGSQQFQGEVMELAIEDYLKNTFVFDSVDEVKKGESGADCLQTINTYELKNCGKIIYESKRTKSFGGEWIEKLKADMRGAGADVAILVTQTMPKDMDRMGLMDGVWVCDFSEFKGLCAVIRENLIQIARIKRFNQNRTAKVDLLYNYLVSNEFASQIRAVANAFESMQDGLNKERNAMQKIWQRREKEIAKARDNAINIHANISSIAGGEVLTIMEEGILELEDFAKDTDFID